MLRSRLAVSGIRRHAASAGFTLVELMTVVAITGILAAIGVALVRGHVNVAKANRALAGIEAIRVAEEAFRAQNGQYLNCSPGSSPTYYPMATPGKLVYDWRQPTHTDWSRWQALGVPRDGGTQYGFLVNAGSPTTAYPTLKVAANPTLPATSDPWYVIQVKGDIDGDGVFMLGAATSINGEVYLEKEGE